MMDKPHQTHLHLRLDEVGDEFIVETLIVNGRVAGQITLKIGEYQLIGAALGMGADQTQGHLRVTHDKIDYDKEGNFKMPEKLEELFEPKGMLPPDPPKETK